MPRFYFNIRQGGRSFRDPEGHELANLAEALEQAKRVALELVLQDMLEKPIGECLVEILDEKGVVVLSLPMGEALQRPN